MEQYRNPALPPEQRAADLLSRMTLREKVGQLAQRLYGFGIYTRDGDRIRLSQELADEVAKHLCAQGETTGGINASWMKGLYIRKIFFISFLPVLLCIPGSPGEYRSSAAHWEIPQSSS